jgi:nitroreductase
MIDLLIKRRSIRKYTDDKIEENKLEILKKAALLAPTGKNKKECEFVFVDDKEILIQLSNVKPQGGKMIESAALAVVVVADETKSDIWIEDASVAATTIHYAAQDLGLGSCWVQIRKRMFDYDKEISSESLVRDILNLGEDMKVHSIISIGYPEKWRSENDVSKLDYSKIHTNKY